MGTIISFPDGFDELSIFGRDSVDECDPVLDVHGDGWQTLGMRLLVLGGTWFLGRTLVEESVARGWEVTCFNRGRTGQDVPGVVSVRGDRTDPQALAGLAEAGPWDAVVDTCGYEPPEVDLSVSALHHQVGIYVLISTISVYRDWPEQAVSESSTLWSAPSGERASDPQMQQLPGPVSYGMLKAGCEDAVRSTFGPATLIIRPGVVLGPSEYVGRLPVLLRRAAAGGVILAAADQNRSIQPVDARDLVAFILDRVAARTVGDFNTTAPAGHSTYGALLAACLSTTGSTARIVWVDPAWLDEQGVRQWTQIPLWRTALGTWAVDSTAAQRAGLTCRPLTQTVADTWQRLLIEEPVPHPRLSDHGLAPEREQDLLRRWALQASI